MQFRFRMTAAATAAVLALTAGAASAALKDGTYEGESVGRNGPMTVEAVVTNGRIASVTVRKHMESKGVSDAAVALVPKAIVDNQSLAVDGIAGATLSSRAIMAGAKAALAKAGDISALLVPPVRKKAAAHPDETADVVVVGSGEAGLMAALAAKKSGGRVVLLEKQGMLGGGDSMNISTGITGGGGKLIKELGIKNASAEDFYQALVKQAAQKKVPANKEMLRTYAMRTPEIIDYLMEIGVPFGQYDINRRMFLTKDGSAPGPHIIKALSAQFKAAGIDYRLNSPATALLGSHARVTGVTVKTADGGTYKISSKAVILATGGFSASHDLLEKYQPKWIGRPTTGASSLTGDGIKMAVPFGASLASMGEVKANYLCHQLTKKEGVSLTAITPWTILVNHDGRRFVDEGHPSINFKSEAEMKQPRHEAYAVIDDKAMQSLKIMQNYLNAGYFVKADTIEELADKLDVKKDAFIATVKAYQAVKEGDRDPAFSRKVLHSISQPPYYAALVTPSMQSTYGGLRTDVKARVLDAAGKPIPGLFAAGSVSGHECYANEVGFAAVIALTFGRIAGEEAGAEAAAVK